MEQHQDPRDPQIENCLKLLEVGLRKIPEVQPGVDFMWQNPNQAYDIYAGYLAVIDRMSILSSDELVAIGDSKARLIASGDPSGSASLFSATDLIAWAVDAEFLGQVGRRSTIASSLGGNQFFNLAHDDLATRIERGHQLKEAGKTPEDGDPESDEVIWGQTVISDPLAQTHFIIAHYLERYFARELIERNFAAAGHKDFFLSALTDVLIVDHLNAKEFDSIFELWARPKDQGGLGWITADRLRSYGIDEQTSVL